MSVSVRAIVGTIGAIVRCIMANRTRRTFAPLTAEQSAALREYAARYGRTWKSELLSQWSYAQVARYGAVLHGLRNSHGPEWLASFKLDAVQS